ncbi:MAG: DUF4387 domain-containing protein [Armatimonadota bacterium]
MRLYDCATSLRSKNAGPFTLTIDVVLPDEKTFRQVAEAAALSAERVAALYGVESRSVRIVPFERVLTVKITLPRPGASSGAPGDRDVYGCQQHSPLADVQI